MVYINLKTHKSLNLKTNKLINRFIIFYVHKMEVDLLIIILYT